jgi:hypothetical protein
MLDNIESSAISAALGIGSGGVMGALSSLLETVNSIARNNFQILLKKGEFVEASMEKASKRGSRWMRASLVGLAVTGFVVAWIAGFMEFPIQLEQEVTKGWFLWKKTFVQLVQTDGIVVFKELRDILVYSLTFSMGYIGMKSR